MRRGSWSRDAKMSAPPPDGKQLWVSTSDAALLRCSIHGSESGAVIVEGSQSCPLPDDPILAEVAVSVRDSHDWAWIVDRDWRVRNLTDEHRLLSIEADAPFGDPVLRTTEHVAAHMTV